VHGALIAIALVDVERAPDLHAATEPTLELIEVAVEAPVPVPVEDKHPSGVRAALAHSGGTSRARRGEHTRSPDSTSPWGELTIGEDRGDGTGTGTGIGTGAGIGFGDGGGVQKMRELPAVPAPFVSKARPAKLIHPTREMEVDEAELFAARITVDEGGDVVGAHMMKSHPGSRGETASSMIWQFRYAPALDDDGAPVRSTFVQTFAVR
jgi:hypothetical protein